MGSNIETVRRQLAEELLDLEALIASEVGQIEAKKDALRSISDEFQAGFTVAVPGKGSVVVGKGRQGRFTGTLPELNPELFMAMTDDERAALTSAGVITIVAQYSKPAKASVTTKPAP